MTIDYKVSRIKYQKAKEYIVQNHYTKTVCNAGISYGLFDDNKLTEGVLFPMPKLIGVIIFCSPISENVRSSVFGKEKKSSVIELSRLHILDVTPKNTESYFISKSMNLLKKDYPKYKAVISYADSTENHTGTIYRASNFYYLGKTPLTDSYLDNKNRLHTYRQNGINYKPNEVIKLGWKKVKRNFKYRYLYFLGNKYEKKILKKQCIYKLDLTWSR